MKLEVKAILVDMKVLSEIAKQNGDVTGCIAYDIDALDCRAGCPICPLNDILIKLMAGFPGMDEGPGNYG